MSTCPDDNDIFRTNNIVNAERSNHAVIYAPTENGTVSLDQLYLKTPYTFPNVAATNTPDNSAKRRIKNFSLQEKVRVLDDVKAGRSKAEVRKEFGIGESTLRRWVHDEQKIRDALHEENASRKKLRPDDNPYVGEALIAWYNRCKQDNIPLSGLVLREKALELNKMLGGKENFTASSEWFTNWKRKYGLPYTLNTTFPEVENNKPPEDSALNQLTMTLTNAVEEESLLRCQIFKCDKSVMHYKSLPGRTMSGDRVTIMTCSNADGSLKLPLVVLGKSLKSTTLVNLQHCLPIFYAHQTSTWLDSDALNEWFDSEFTPRVTDFLKARNLPLKAILVAENVPSDAFQNRPTSELQIHLILHNLSLVIGPIDNESLQCVKLNYAQKLLTAIVAAQQEGESSSDFLRRTNLRDFIYWITCAWNEVEPTSIVKCWRKLLPDNEESRRVVGEAQNVNGAIVLDTLRRVKEYRDAGVDEVAKWIAENHETSRISIDNHVIEIVVKDDNEEQVDVAENMCENTKTVSASEALNGLNDAITFFEQNGCTSVAEMMTLVKLKERALNLKINGK